MIFISHEHHQIISKGHYSRSEWVSTPEGHTLFVTNFIAIIQFWEWIKMDIPALYLVSWEFVDRGHCWWRLVHVKPGGWWWWLFKDVRGKPVFSKHFPVYFWLIRLNAFRKSTNPAAMSFESSNLGPLVCMPMMEYWVEQEHVITSVSILWKASLIGSYYLISKQYQPFIDGLAK